MVLSIKSTFTVLLILYFTVSQAQQVRLVRSQPSSGKRIDQGTLITNQMTGEKITMEKFEEISKPDPFAYHLIPNYNEYGVPNGYQMRQSTPEEHETHRFRDRDPAKQPKAGQVIAPFVMTGLDDRIYRSSELIGKVVVLNFLIGLDKTYWNDEQNDRLSSILKPYQTKGGLVGLGVLNSEQAKLVKGAKENVWPFMPVPNAYGFHNKYHITSVPTFIILDKTGTVVANLQGVDSFDKMKQILAALPQ